MYIKIENGYFELNKYFIILLFLLYFNQINAALVSIKALINLTSPKPLNGSVCKYYLHTAEDFYYKMQLEMNYFWFKEAWLVTHYFKV